MDSKRYALAYKLDDYIYKTMFKTMFENGNKDAKVINICCSNKLLV